MAGGTILSIGRIYCDLIFQGDLLPNWGHETFARDFACAAGGGAFITGAYLTALGHEVRLGGNAGSADPFGSVIARDAATCGIDATLLAVGQVPQVTVALAGARDRAFLTHRDPSAIAVPEVSDLAHIHVGELSTLAEAPGLIDLAGRCGATLSCDCGDESSYPPNAPELIAALDLFLPSQPEWHALERAGLAAMPRGVLVLKMGARGACVRGAKGESLFQAAMPAQLCDTTGAGDAFNAGFLHGWLGDGDLAGALREGVRCGAAAISALGGWSGRAGLMRASSRPS